MQVEACEPRVLLAGNVNISFDGDNVELVGDERSNDISIRFDGANIVVQGNRGTRINGSQDPFVLAAGSALPERLSVLLLGGNDTVFIEDINVGEQVFVDAGDGNDKVGIVNSNAQSIGISLGQGRDTLFGLRIEATNFVSVSDDGGNTRAFLAVVTAGTQLSMKLPDGRHEVIVDTVNAGELLNVQSVGRLSALIRSARAGQLLIGGSAGNDAIFLDTDTTQAGVDSTIALNEGNDLLAFLGGSHQSPLTASGGDGRDSLVLTPDVLFQNGFAQSDFEQEFDDLDDVPRGRSTLSGLERTAERLAESF